MVRPGAKGIGRLPALESPAVPMPNAWKSAQRSRPVALGLSGRALPPDSWLLLATPERGAGDRASTFRTALGDMIPARVRPRSAWRTVVSPTPGGPADIADRNAWYHSSIRTNCECTDRRPSSRSSSSCWSASIRRITRSCLTDGCQFLRLPFPAIETANWASQGSS